MTGLVGRSDDHEAGAAVLRRLIDGLPVMTYVLRLRPDGSLQAPFVSPQVRDVFGVDAVDAQAHPERLFELALPEESAGLQESILRSAAELTPWSMDLGIVHPRKGVRVVAGRSIPDREPDGSVVWHGFARDVTDEQRLLRLFQQTESAARIAGWELDRLTGELFWTDEAFRLHDLDPADRPPPGAALLELYPVELHRPLTERHEALLRDGDSYELDLPVTTRAGSRRTLRITARAQVRNGQVVRAYGTMMDVTAELEARRALEEGEARYRALVERAGEGIWEIDEDARTTYVNERMARMLGREPAELVGQSYFDILAPGGAPTVRANLAERREGRATTYEVPLRHADGHEVWVSVTGTPRTDPDGRIRGSFAIVVDVTERRQAEATLRRAKDQAEAIARAKTEFVTTVSHEIRTPLNGILGMTQLLQTTRLDAEQATFVDAVRASSETLVALVDDILDFSRLEAGGLAVERRAVDVHRVVEDTGAVLRGQLAQKQGVVLETMVAEDVPPRVVGDPARLRQVLLNLGGNAAKFTRRGIITIAVERAPTDDGAGVLRWSVSDTGIGLDPVDAERLFEPFVQGDASTTRRFGGSGLGLAICRRLVRRMGGDIVVDGAPGRGACFTVALPFEPVEDLPDLEEGPGTLTPSLVPAPGHGRRVLVAEDNAVNRMVVRQMLQRLGAYVEEAMDGESAVAAVAAGGFDLVLMDLQMPRLDGLDAVRAIRAAPGPGRTVPIVALTANAFEDQRQACFAAGMDDYLTKPLRLAALDDILRRWAMGAGREAAS